MDDAQAEANVNAFLECGNDEPDDVATGSGKDADEDYEIDEEINEEVHKATRNMCDLPLTALMAMKYNSSNRGTAAIITGFLIDMEIVSSIEDAAKVLDHKKIYR